MLYFVSLEPFSFEALADTANTFHRFLGGKQGRRGGYLTVPRRDLLLCTAPPGSQTVDCGSPANRS